MKNKKAQGLPVNTIIIAVLALFVLVIIVLLVTRGTFKFSEGLADCKSKGGRECVNESFSDPDNPGKPCKSNEAPTPGICKGGLLCCIPIS